MQKVNQVTVKALELKASRLSTLDAKVLRGQVLEGEIFGAFSEQERVAIRGRLQAVDDLIPSLFTFFENVKYLEACVNCVKRLISLSSRNIVFIALEKTFCDANQRADRAVIQVTEFSFTCSSASLTDQVDLSYRQLHAYAMRHYLQMSRELKEKELLARLMINTDETMLRDFADLADRLGFEFLEIIALKQCSKSTVARARSERSKSLLVTNGVDEIKKRRCELSRVENYVENDEFLFVNHLHNEKEKQSEEITSFFVRKFVYFAFFERSILLILNSIPRVSDRTDENMNRSQDTHISQKRRKQEQQRQKLKRQEQQRQKQERLKRQKLKRQKQEQKRQNLKRQKQEQQRQKLKRLKLKRLKLKRLKLKRQKQEQKRQKLKRQEQEQKRLKQKQKRQKQKILKRLEQERQEQERQEQERSDKKRLERERLREKQKMIEQERLKKERLKKEERERQEQEERERQKQEKRERQKQEQRERQKQEKRKRQEQKERKRQKQEERKRQKQEERKRQKQEEREIQKQEKRERQKQEERERQKQEERERQKQERRERLEYQSLENQQRLQNQQRLEQEELLEKEELDQEEMNQQTEQDVNRGETSANLPSTKKARKPETQLEKRSDNTKIRINFKFREEDFWKDASFLMIDSFDSFEVERVAKKKIREKIRLFDIELRMLTSQECYQAVMINGTYTVLLIRESEIYIDDELQISAMNVRIDVLSHQQHMLKRVAINDISQLHHVRKKHHRRVFI